MLESRSGDSGHVGEVLTASSHVIMYEEDQAFILLLFLYHPLQVTGRSISAMVSDHSLHTLGCYSVSKTRSP
jgi:hypothetical protein